MDILQPTVPKAEVLPWPTWGMTVNHISTIPDNKGGHHYGVVSDFNRYWPTNNPTGCGELFGFSPIYARYSDGLNLVITQRADIIRGYITQGEYRVKELTFYSTKDCSGDVAFEINIPEDEAENFVTFEPLQIIRARKSLYENIEVKNDDKIVIHWQSFKAVFTNKEIEDLSDVMEEWENLANMPKEKSNLLGHGSNQGDNSVRRQPNGLDSDHSSQAGERMDEEEEGMDEEHSEIPSESRHASGSGFESEFHLSEASTDNTNY